MSLYFQPFLRKTLKANIRRFSAIVSVKDIVETDDIPLPEFRTNESNPVNHTEQHLNKFYTVEPELYKILYHSNSFPKTVYNMFTCFNECSLLIRKPAIEMITDLNMTDFTKPVNRYVLYGVTGSGKTTTLAHMLHYAFMKQFVLVHMPVAYNWFMYPMETSSLTPGLIDLTVHSSKWLTHFKRQNIDLLKNLDLKTSKDYVWNARETTKQGSPLLELIDFGIDRTKFAAFALDGLLSELKLASTSGKCKTFVAIDGYNIFWTGSVNLCDEERNRIPPEKLTITQTMKDITNFDWCNGVVIVTVDKCGSKEKKDSHLPRYLLGKNGFEHLDPFIPIHIENYNTDEFESVIEYYKDRKWIRYVTDRSNKEIESVTNKNPWNVLEYCKSL